MTAPLPINVKLATTVQLDQLVNTVKLARWANTPEPIQRLDVKPVKKATTAIRQRRIIAQSVSIVIQQMQPLFKKLAQEDHIEALNLQKK